jgi:polysaccharide export outer membrane protein
MSSTRICTKEKAALWLSPVFLALGVFCYLASPACAQQTGNPVASIQRVSPVAPVVEDVAATPSSQTDLIVGTGDLLEVSIYQAPEFDRQVRVDDSGEISLPLLGSVKVSGLTIRQTEQLIERRLSSDKYFTEPRVSVFAKEYVSGGISVMGEVHKPGIYPMLGGHTLFDVISAAGGTTPTAGPIVSIIHRRQPDQTETVKYDTSNNSYHNVELLSGDTVIVSQAAIVYVVGDVHLPGGFVMARADLTVLQAIAMAQGTNPMASLNGAKLIRTNAGERQEIHLPLKEILAGKSKDYELQANDIIFVPNSAAKSAAHKTMEAILQAATGIAIYKPY